MDANRRTTLCLGCGGVVEAPPLADRASCASCGLSSDLPPRRAEPQAPAPFTQDTALRTSVVTTLAVSPDLQPLWEGERSIPSHREAEAFAVYTERRKELLAGERARELDFVVLARELGIRMLAHGDAERARATLESALDASTSKLARACLLGALVRTCLRTGDVAAAGGFLRLFDPSPSELLEDTELRVSAAAIAAARSDDATILAWLGTSEEEVASHVMLAWLVSLLRARALELGSRTAEARAELVDLLGRRPTALEAIDHNLPRLPYLGELATWPEVRREFLERTRKSSDLQAEGRVVIAIALLLLGGMCLFAFYQHASRDWLLFAVGLAITLPLVYTGTRLSLLGRGLHRAFVRGRPVTATILGLELGLYGRGRHNRLTKVRLELELDGAKVESADHRFLDPRDHLRWKAGAKVTAFVDASRPAYAVITTPPL